MSKSPKVLLIGSSYSSAPILKNLKKRDLYVTVCGAAEQDPCHAYADASLFVDYSDSLALLRETEKGDFDFIVPSCNDTAYMAGVSLAKEFGYPGFDTEETAHILHTKHRFREYTSARSLPAPRWTTTHDSTTAKSIPLPKLVKPVDAFSGRGVTKVYDEMLVDAAVEAAIAASTTGLAVIEEFVEGTLHSHSAFVQDGKIVTDFFVDEFCTVYPYQVDCSNHPSALSDKIRTSIRSTMQTLITDLKLCDGLLHTQLIVKDKQIWIIECMRRAPGDLYPHLITKSTGFPYFDYYIRPFLSEKMPDVDRREDPCPIARHTISKAQGSSLFSLSIDLPFPPKDMEIIPLKESGQSLGAAPFDKAAIVFSEFPDMDSLCQYTSRLANHLTTRTLENLDGSHE